VNYRELFILAHNRACPKCGAELAEYEADRVDQFFCLNLECTQCDFIGTLNFEAVSFDPLDDNAKPDGPLGEYNATTLENSMDYLLGDIHEWKEGVADLHDEIQPRVAQLQVEIERLENIIHGIRGAARAQEVEDGSTGTS